MTASIVRVKPLRYIIPQGETLEQMRDAARSHPLAQEGDMTLVWVNEGDLHNHSVWWNTRAPDPDLDAAVNEALERAAAKMDAEWSYRAGDAIRAMKKGDGEMTAYRKKPVVIEAVQWDGTNYDEIVDWMGASATCQDDEDFVIPDACHLYRFTVEDGLRASIGDWIIKGVKGEFYPCKPDIFAATYEPADTRAPDPDLDAAVNEALERAEAAVHAARDRVSTLALEVLGMTGAETELRLATGDGKYEVVLSGGDAYATRHGERWRDLTGAPLTVALARELKGCRDAITALGGDPLAPGRTPAHYGAERDLLRLTLKDGSGLVQDAEGRFTATRDGVELPGLTGDKLTLTLAYELEGARAALAQLRPDTTPEPTGPDTTPEPTGPDETPEP